MLIHTTPLCFLASIFFLFFLSAQTTIKALAITTIAKGCVPDALLCARTGGVPELNSERPSVWDLLLLLYPFLMLTALELSDAHTDFLICMLAVLGGILLVSLKSHHQQRQLPALHPNLHPPLHPPHHHQQCWRQDQRFRCQQSQWWRHRRWKKSMTSHRLLIVS